MFMFKNVYCKNNARNRIRRKMRQTGRYERHESAKMVAILPAMMKQKAFKFCSD